MLRLPADFSRRDGEAASADLVDQAKAVVEAGADGIVIHRADRVVAFGLWDALRNIARGTW